MHPAPSVIFFTAASGLGFGLLAWLGFGLPNVSGWAAFAYYFVGYGLAVGGLLASTFHLANPKNAIKAFSQWRSSWLSREGISAIVALVLIAPYAIGRIFFDTTIPWLGALGSIMALVTVFTTSMIYAQLKTIPRWNTRATPMLFMAYTLTGGALLAAQVDAAPALLALAAAIQIWHWRSGDRAMLTTQTNLGTATGLGSIGHVRQFEAPHTGQNYLLDEMAYQVGRKHARSLRRISFVAAFLVPVLAIFAFNGSPFVAAVIAVVFHAVGVSASRWLFFAEARHVVANYYDR